MPQNPVLMVGASKDEKSVPLASSDASKQVQRTVSSFSFKSLANLDDSVLVVKEDVSSNKYETAVSAPAAVKKTVSLEELVIAWKLFAQNLPHNEVALAQRLEMIEPLLVSENEFEVVAENPTVEKLLNSLSLRIVQFLQKQINCPELKMSVRLRDVAERPAMLSRNEQFIQMKANNPAFAKLADNLNLVL